MWSFFRTSKATFKHVRQNQVPVDSDDESYEYDDNFDEYDEENDQIPLYSKYTPFSLALSLGEKRGPNQQCIVNPDN